MPTPAGQNAIYSTSAQVSSFFIDKVGQIWVSAYGAVGDGVTDDTAKVQAAIDAANTKKIKEVNFVGGKTYKVTSLKNTTGITFIGNNVTITGGASIVVESLSTYMADVESIIMLGKIKDKMLRGETVIIVCYGDSITYGHDSDNTGAQSPDPYPEVLQARLRAIYGNNNITVINAGHSGWTTTDAVGGLPAVLAYNADLVILMFGINDVRTSLSIDTYRNNLKTLTSTIKKNGPEVLLLTPTPILETVNDNMKRLQIFSHVVREVATEKNIAFIDIFSQIMRLWFTGKLDPTQTLPDYIHFADEKYALIADIILYSMLQSSEATSVLYVDSKNEFSVPVVGLPYFKHNLSYAYVNNYVTYTRGYRIMTGESLRFDFFCAQPGMDLILRSAKNAAGGILTVYDNDVEVAKVDFFANAAHLYNCESPILRNMEIGWHSILLDYANLVKGNATDPTFLYGYLSDFVFRPTTESENLVFAYTGNAPTAEIFKTATKGKVKLNSTGTTGWSGMLLKDGPNVALDPNKKLAFEYVDILTSAKGAISWFGNTYQTIAGEATAPVNNGYVVYLDTATVYLYYISSNNSLNTIDSETLSLDFNAKHTIRVEHGYDGAISVKIDGVERLTGTDIHHHSGFFGLMTGAPGVTMEVSEIRYCFI